MFFWFKRKKIILDCFTSNSLVYDRHKPEKATNVLPGWFKGLNAQAPNPNLKHCIGFKELFKHSISLNMWTTFRCKVDTQGKGWTWESGDPIVVSKHLPEDYGHFLNTNDYGHLKISTPWSLKTSKYIKFAWVDASWCRDTHDYFFPNAVIDFFYQHGVELNTFINMKGSPYSFKIESGQPLVFLIPLTEDSVEIKTHLLTDSEMHRYRAKEVLGRRRYQIRKKHTDRLVSQQKKCPFGFGG